MADVNQWAILLCRYNDDTNDPSVVTMKQLAAQLTPAPPATAPGWITPAWQADNKYHPEEIRALVYEYLALRPTICPISSRPCPMQQGSI